MKVTLKKNVQVIIQVLVDNFYIWLVKGLFLKHQKVRSQVQSLNLQVVEIAVTVMTTKR